MSVHKIDLNGDANSDLIFQDETSGNVSTLLMHSDQPFAAATYQISPIYPSTYKIAGLGDFDGSGTTDLFVHGLSDGNVVEWLTGTNGVVEGTQTFGAVPASYDIAAASGDYNNDGKSDLLWRGESDGQLTMWLMDGINVSAMVSLGRIPVGYSVVDGVSDFTGDGKSDILFRGMDDGQTTLWAMNGGQIEQRFDFGQIPTSLSILDTHTDLNGDGTHDILWYDQSNGNVVEWLMHEGLPSTNIVANVSPTSNTSLISADGDYNGDGVSDMLWDVGGKLVMWTMNTLGGIFSIDYLHDTHGNQMQISPTQVVEDAIDSFDGTSHSSITVRDTGTGAVQVWSMLGPTVTGITNISAGANGTITNGNGSGIIINADQAQAYYGTDGNDTFLIQSSGATVTGGAGDNVFHISGGATITDFKPNADQIVLDRTAFNFPFGGPVFNPGIVGFTSGTSGPYGVDGRYEFYYQTTTGQLWYAQPAGSIANSYGVIATLQNHPALSSHDLLMV